MQKRRALTFVLAFTVALASCSSTRTRTSPARHAQALAAFDAPRLQNVADVACASVERGDYAGVSYLVVRDGETVLEGGCGFADVEERTPMRPDTIVRIYSMSKVFTCVAALQLVDDGVVKLDDPITKWLPEFASPLVFTGGTVDAPVLEPLARPITVKNLLNHTAGFTYDFFPGAVAELYQRADLWNAPSLDEFVTRAAKLPLVRQPGRAFDYGISDDVLGALIQRASGMPFDEFVARRITQPLGLHDTGFDVPAEKFARLAALHVRDGKTLKTGPVIIGAYAERGRGFPSGGGGMFSTIRDYARFAQCLLEKGELDGVRILARGTVERALENSLPAGVTTFDAATGWGLFSGVRLDVPAAENPASPGTFTWAGAATTLFFADPKQRLVALFFAQHTPYDERQMFPRFSAAVYAALK